MGTWIGMAESLCCSAETTATLLKLALCVCLCVLVAQSCLTLQPHGPQPARPLSMGFSRQVYWSGCVLVIQSYPTLCDHGLQPSRLLCPWDFPGKNTGVGCYFLLQLEWVAIPFSKGSSLPRDLAFQTDSLPSESTGKP